MYMQANIKMTEPQLKPIDARGLRTALGQFATGVTAIVTRDADDALVGLTANSFAAVSLDPPLVLWSLRKAARSYQAFCSCSHFVINVLAGDQINIARKFSVASADRFAGISWKPGPASALPVFDGVAAWFECKALNSFEAGDHTIFVGEVLSFSHEEREPLLFHGGSYTRTYELLAF